MHDTYTLGMHEVASGSAQSMLDKVKEILDDLSASASTSNGKDTQTEIVTQIKSTMSDRASTEMFFNELLANYREEILPLVVKNWEELSQKEKESCQRCTTFSVAFILLFLWLKLPLRPFACLKRPIIKIQN